MVLQITDFWIRKKMDEEGRIPNIIDIVEPEI